MDLRLGPDERRAALVIIGESGDGQIWIADLARGVRSLLASASWSYGTPVWSSAGDRLLYGSQERGSIDLYTKSPDGSGEQQAVFVDDRDKTVFDWTADGKYVVYWPVGDGSGTSNVWVYSLEDERTVPLLTGDAAYTDVRFSPDGRWLAYVSDESGRLEVFVQAFDTTKDQPRVGGRWQLSTAGGEQPHWRADGREVVYVSLERKVMAVSLEPDPGGLQLEAPRELFEIAGLPVALDATGDHRRFLVATREPAATRPLNVVLNWPAAL